MEPQSPDISSTPPTQPLASASKWLPRSIPFIHTESFQDYLLRFVATGLITPEEFKTLQTHETGWADLMKLHSAARTIVAWSDLHGIALEGMQLEDQNTLLDSDEVLNDAMDLMIGHADTAIGFYESVLGTDVLEGIVLIRFITEPFINVGWCFLFKLRQACPALVALWAAEAEKEEEDQFGEGEELDGGRESDLGDHPMER